MITNHSFCNKRNGTFNFYAVGDNSYFYLDNVCFEENYPFYTTQGGRIMPPTETVLEEKKNLDLKKHSIPISDM